MAMAGAERSMSIAQTPQHIIATITARCETVTTGTTGTASVCSVPSTLKPAVSGAPRLPPAPALGDPPFDTGTPPGAPFRVLLAIPSYPPS
jgi:hypothetical protein